VDQSTALPPAGRGKKGRYLSIIGGGGAVVEKKSMPWPQGLNGGGGAVQDGRGVFFEKRGENVKEKNFLAGDRLNSCKRKVGEKGLVATLLKHLSSGST